nr:MAG TPA: hypothetical protein [Caudoviricetes sp.]
MLLHFINIIQFYIPPCENYNITLYTILQQYN